MEWKFFLGSCLLTAALIVPYAGVRPVAMGMVLAAAIRWAWSRMPHGPV